MATTRRTAFTAARTLSDGDRADEASGSLRLDLADVGGVLAEAHDLADPRDDGGYESHVDLVRDVHRLPDDLVRHLDGPVGDDRQVPTDVRGAVVPVRDLAGSPARADDPDHVVPGRLDTTRHVGDEGLCVIAGRGAGS